MEKFYIHRTLLVDDKPISDIEILDQANILIILAEPGAGKSDLLGYLAGLLQTKPVRASIFKHQTTHPVSPTLVLDAMDEVARIDRVSTDEIIVRAHEVTASKAIFAGRSSEWDKASTQFIKEVFGQKPIVARLLAFNDSEQCQLFEHFFPGENFERFKSEAQKFELAPLLGNPQFLQLLGEAYSQSDRHFASKSQIFSDAVRRLAHEMNPGPGQRSKPSVDAIIAEAEEVFAKLMLSGATGVASVEYLKHQDFPYIGSLCDPHHDIARFLLDTRLFKPSIDADQHEPVHRIVSEYCAANYLAKRISDVSDRLSLKRLLAIIAPNRVVRDELRGMLGWLAAVGDECTQKATIKLDPYAILANGDPSQLRTSSKIYLIDQLQSLVRRDPYFRRSDGWRTFNVGQFFAKDVIERLKPILTPSSPSPSLTQLVLELLPGTEAAAGLRSELRAIVLNKAAGDQTRMLALKVLKNGNSEDLTQDVVALIAENSHASLRAAASIVETSGVKNVGADLVVQLLQKISCLYPTERSHRERSVGSRYFVRKLIGSFSQSDTAHFLDVLTKNLQCICNPKNEFACNCRVGISKVAGHLLDRYFSEPANLYEPERIWRWTQHLHFYTQGNHSSAAISMLSSNDALRQAIHRLALSKAENLDDALKIRSRFFYSSAHAGLRFQADDLIAIALYAYEENKPHLWQAVYGKHNEWGDKKKDNLRRVLREHAHASPVLMRIWAKLEREAKHYRQEERSSKRRYRTGRYERQQERIRERNRIYLEANKDFIESGRHWNWLKVFGQRYLMDQDDLDEEVYEPETAEKALRNCFPFLLEHTPTLEELSSGQGSLIARVLHSACVVHFRDGNGLEHIDRRILMAAKTETAGYPGFRDGEEEAFEAELDRILFPGDEEAEKFARSFIEPRLAKTESSITRVEWLNYKQALNGLREFLPLEWLHTFPEASYSTLQSLFDMAAQYGDRQTLQTLIAKKATTPLALPEIAGEANKAEKHRHRFWQLNAFLYLTSPPQSVWDEFKADPDSIFLIEGRLSMLHSGDHVSTPPISAEKIYQILDAYVDAWPRVPLPSSWGTGSPKEETAYRFLCDIVWKIEKDLPDRSLPVVDRLLADPRFDNFRNSLLTQRASVVRKLALQGFQAPSTEEVGKLLDNGQVASVEDLRALLLEELENFQVWVRAADTDPIDPFYNNGQHVDENTARNRIVDKLDDRMKVQNLSVVIEHHMARGNRCDFTATTMISGVRKLLPIEVKGQWHSKLYQAASEQLETRYMIHPDAARQGIYLVLWFGPDVKIAGRKNTALLTPSDLRNRILSKMPQDLHPFVDVFVLDLSLPK